MTLQLPARRRRGPRWRGRRRLSQAQLERRAALTAAVVALPLGPLAGWALDSGQQPYEPTRAASSLTAPATLAPPAVEVRVVETSTPRPRAAPVVTRQPPPAAEPIATTPPPSPDPAPTSSVAPTSEPPASTTPEPTPTVEPTDVLPSLAPPTLPSAAPTTQGDPREAARS